MAVWKKEIILENILFVCIRFQLYMLIKQWVNKEITAICMKVERWVSIAKEIFVIEKVTDNLSLQEIQIVVATIVWIQEDTLSFT